MSLTGTQSKPQLERSGRTLTLATATVADVMHEGVFSCPYETPLTTVARIMATQRVHFVVGLDDLADDGTPRWGVVSDRDVLAAVVYDDFERQTAGTCAATPVVTVGPGDSLVRAAELMRYEGLTDAVVIHPGTDRPIGILSTLDIAAVAGGVAVRRPEHGAVHIDQLMSSPVVTVRPDLPLKDVAALLVEHDVSGVPVADGKEIVGIVSEADIVALERGPDDTRRWPIADRILRRRRPPTPDAGQVPTARDVMSSPVVTIAPWQLAASAAALMAEHRYKRLPVVARGELVGIVSRSDLLRAFARTDEQIAREIVDEVLTRQFWLNPGAVQVRVSNGIVSLAGAVGEIDAELLPGAVQRVPGVVGVESKLTVSINPE